MSSMQRSSTRRRRPNCGWDESNGKEVKDTLESMGLAAHASRFAEGGHVDLDLFNGLRHIQLWQIGRECGLKPRDVEMFVVGIRRMRQLREVPVELIVADGGSWGTQPAMSAPPEEQDSGEAHEAVESAAESSESSQAQAEVVVSEDAMQAADVASTEKAVAMKHAKKSRRKAAKKRAKLQAAKANSVANPEDSEDTAPTGDAPAAVPPDSAADGGDSSVVLQSMPRSCQGLADLASPAAFRSAMASFLSASSALQLVPASAKTNDDHIQASMAVAAH